jgi:hypothetical protein
MAQHQQDLLASKIFMQAAGMPPQGTQGNKPPGSQPKANAGNTQQGA